MFLNRIFEMGNPRHQAAGGEDESSVGAGFAVDGIFDRDPVPVGFLDGDGRIASSNPAFNQLWALDGAADAIAGRVREAIASGTARREEVDFSTLGEASAAEHAAGVWEFIILPLPGGDGALVQAHDTSRDHALRDALVDSRRRYKDLVEISSDFVWETGADGNFAFVSPGGAIGYAPDDMIGRHPVSFVPDTMPTESALPFLATNRITDVDIWFRRADDRVALLVASATPIFGEDGGWLGARGVCRDITEARERDQALAAARTREGLLAHIIRGMHDEIDPTKTLTTAATETAQALSAVNGRIYRGDPKAGFALDSEFGAPPIDDDLEQSLLARAAVDGEPIMAADADRHLMCVATSYRKQINGAISVTRAADAGPWTHEDVTLAREVAMQLAIAIEQIDYHNRLETMSRTDEMTGLLNRRAFLADLDARINGNLRTPGAGALFFVDLDNFKLVNDVHGHQRGDEALIAVSSVLRANTRPGDLVARFGGDEFALWLDRTEEQAAVDRAEELLSAAKVLREFSGDEARPLGMSIGIAPWKPGAAETIDDLTNRADEAMYEIKHGSKSGYVVASEPPTPAVS